MTLFPDGIFVIADTKWENTQNTFPNPVFFFHSTKMEMIITVVMSYTWKVLT
jgi:hypothetical protein